MDLEQVKVVRVERESILHILTLFAFFNILKISEDLFRTYYDSSNDPPTRIESFPPDSEWDEFTYVDVIASSLKLSLLQKSPVESEEPLFSIHPLIRDWMQMWIEKEEHSKYVNEAISILVSYIENHKDEILAPDKRQELLSHLDVSMEMDSQCLPERHQLGYGSLEMAGSLFATYYDSSGRFKEAEELLKRMLGNELVTKKQDLESDNESTLEIIVKVSQVYFRRGRYEEAVRLAEHCYQGYQTACTSNISKPQTVAMNLADCYYKLGKNDEAKNLYSSSLKAYESHYHPGHENIFLACESISGVLRTHGEHAAAFELWHKVLAGKETSLGKNHPTTLRTVVALASNYRAQSQYDRALPMLLPAVTSCTASLGEDHPDTLNVFIHLGILYRTMRRAEEAEEMLNRVAEKGEVVRGKSS